MTFEKGVGLASRYSCQVLLDEAVARHQGLLEGDHVQEADALLVLAQILVTLEKHDQHLDAEARVDLSQLALPNLIPPDEAIAEHIVAVCQQQPRPWQLSTPYQLPAIVLELLKLIIAQLPQPDCFLHLENRYQPEDPVSLPERAPESHLLLEHMGLDARLFHYWQSCLCLLCCHHLALPLAEIREHELAQQISHGAEMHVRK